MPSNLDLFIMDYTVKIRKYFKKLRAIVECMTCCKELLSPLAGRNQSDLSGINRYLGDSAVPSISMRLLRTVVIVIIIAHKCFIVPA